MDENDAYGIAMTQVSCGYWLLANRSYCNVGNSTYNAGYIK